MVVVVGLVGCGAAPLPGAPQLGTACDQATTVRECYSAQEVAFCNEGQWESYPCEGRCSNEQSPRCIIKKTEGAACPVAWENSADCISDTQQAVCSGGKWVFKSCGSCTQTSFSSTCS